MKIALCLSGQPRHVETAYNNIKEHLLDKYSPDVFVHTWLNKEDVGKKYVNSWNHLIDHPVSDDILTKIFNLYDPKKFSIENQIILNPYKWNDYGKNMLSMFYSMKQSNILKSKYEFDNDFRYDIVIRARFDTIYNTEFNILDYDINNTIYALGKNSHQNGVNDIFAFGNSNKMDVYNNTIDHIFNIKGIKPEGTNIMCGETFLYDNIVNKNCINLVELPVDYLILRE